MNNKSFFGTDGVRGLVGTYPINEAGAEQVGRAVGAYFAKVGQSVVIGCDTRESSELLVAALAKGLTRTGINVVLVGIVPTPGLAYITREKGEFVAGIMVTASHNPYKYNGIKVFNEHGGKLSDTTEAKLNMLINSTINTQQPGNVDHKPDLVQIYEDFLVSSGRGLNLNGLKIAIDTANGAATGIGARVFQRLGAQVTPIFDYPNGRNINAECGATNTAALVRQVLDSKLDLGIALDGDADRLILVDGLGREVKGDHILYILAMVRGYEGVVATVMSNFGLELALKEQGIALERTDVGDRYVLEGLSRTGYKLGGEQSGHIILPDLLATGDGLLAAVQTLQAISNSDKDLAQWRDAVTLLPQALVNIPLADKELLKTPEVQQFINTKTQEFAGKGRVIIRPSGTEPIARVMVEADNAQDSAEQIAAELTELITQNHTGDTA